MAFSMKSEIALGTCSCYHLAVMGNQLNRLRYTFEARWSHCFRHLHTSLVGKAGSIGLYLRRDAPTNRPTPNRGTVRADHEGKFRGDALVVVGTGDMFAPLRREAPGLMNSVPDGRALSWR